MTASADGLRLLRAFVLLLLGAPYAASSTAPAPPELKATTLRSFREYVARTEARNQENLRADAFLWIDQLPAPAKSADRESLQRGEIVMERLTGGDTGIPAEIPGGMIHDWRGIVFIPGATLAHTLAILQDYNHHAIYYAPDVERSRIESHEGNHFQVFMRFRRHKVVTVVLNTVQDITYFSDSPTRAHSRSTAISIREVVNAGTPEEQEKSPEEDNGFLWEMETWWRMEERDGGVYVQNEAVTLTRDFPTGLGWLIGPFVSSIPKETLQFTLEATRKAVLGKSAY